jgi:hypothetical protein
MKSPDSLLLTRVFLPIRLIGKYYTFLFLDLFFESNFSLEAAVLTQDR